MAKTYLGSGVAYDATESATYPKGRMKNDTTETAKDGTPLFKDTLDDSYQARMELLRRAGITPNEALESKAESQVADAVQFMQPIAILRVGWDGTSSAIGLMGGKYITGYSAEFVETSVSGTTAVLCKLTIKKDGSATTENLFVSATPAYGLGVPVTGINHGHNVPPASAWEGIYFKNDDDGNVIAGDPDETNLATLRIRSQFIITVYKAD